MKTYQSGYAGDVARMQRLIGVFVWGLLLVVLFVI